MKASVEVASRKEADHIRAGLNDPAVRAFVICMGALSTLPSLRAKKGVLDFVRDYFEEQDDVAQNENQAC